MGQTMATNRAFLLACATVTLLSLTAASSTRADAKPCHTEDSTPHQERSCLIRSAVRSVMAEVAKQAAMAKQPAMEKQAAAKQAATEKQAAEMQAAKAKQAAAKPAAMAKEAATSTAAGKPMAPAASPMVKSATPAASAGSPCLTKDYNDGTVIFRDTCTGEWAQRQR
jgi:hypothetical protein